MSSAASRASGYCVDEDDEGGFRWFGPDGSRQGLAESRTEAERAAQEAERELCRSLRSSA